MKSPSPTTRRRVDASIEPLEARIAPARVIWIDLTTTQGQNVDAHYDNTNGNYFVDTFAHKSDPGSISAAVGGFHSAQGDETFYLPLNAGDTIIVGSAKTQLLTMTAGNAIAFFEDRNHDNEVTPDELVSISLGKGAGLSLVSGLEGSVVANLNDGGTTVDPTGFHGTIDMSDLISTKNTIHNVSVSGDVGGSIMGGGSISNLNLRNAAAIYAGTAALGHSFSFFPNLSDGSSAGNGTITSLSSTGAQTIPAPGEAGASISSISAGSVAVAQAGNGGFGAAGGSLINFQINGTASGFSFTAGNGGAADAASHHLVGGTGGAVAGIYVKGFTDLTPNDVISIHGGKGGVADNVGTGGTGGSVSSVYIGASLQGRLVTPSTDFVADDVLVKAGDGGNGRSGGLGGSLTTVSVTTNTPLDPNLVAHELTHEITLAAGNGGNSTDSTVIRLGSQHGGMGGSIKNLTVTDQSPESQPYDSTVSATALIQAGNGGVTAVSSSGALALGGAGGSIIGANLIGANLLVNAGSGQDGVGGGAGGSLVNVHLDRTSGDYVHHAEFNAGNAGNGTVLNGGAGGLVVNLTTGEGDFTSFLVNVAGTPSAGYNLSGGKGGGSTSGLGGAGGAVIGLNVLDIDSQVGFATLAGDFVLDSGSGGSGGKGGGAGGAILNSQLTSTNLNAFVASGSGGTATTSGNGAAGGLIRSLQLSLDNNVITTVDASHPIAPIAASAHVMAGTGGGGIVNGGAGGSLIAVVARVSNSDSLLPGGPQPLLGGDALLAAGNGGAGGTGAAGAGGLVYLSGGYSAVGSGSMVAGDAGSGGTRPAAGGSIMGTSASALTALDAALSITLQAGNGSAGGAGGSILNVGYGSASTSLLPVPSGNITIKAGDGSAYHSTAARGVDYAGAGGAITGLYGSVTGGAGSLVSITAGNGGAVANGTKLGAGGSVSTVVIQRGPTDPTLPAGVLTIAAGDAGNADNSLATTASAGANGGSVSGVVVGDIGSQTVFRSIAGGDASNGLNTGGTGGSVLNVQVANHDIGVKTGAVYGYTSMGGIFAGLSGAGGKTSGLAGDVKLISANSIASIAAGKSNAPALANTVAQISLNTTGHSTTLPTDTGNAISDVIEFTYHPALAQTASTFNSQTFERVPGGSNDGTQPAGGPSTFTLTIHDPNTGLPQTTVPLDADASAATIQAALQALPAIGTGGATVSQAGGNQAGGTFTVTFNNVALAGSLTGVGAERTAPLSGSATVAQVQAALNGLQVVNDGTLRYPGIPPVTVLSPASASFEIVYGDSNAVYGDVTAEHLITHSATETTPGTASTASVQHLELYGVGQFKIVYTSVLGHSISTDFLNVGASVSDVNAALSNTGIVATVTEPGANTYDVQFTNTGVVGKITVVEYASLSHVQQANNAAGNEVQDINFTPLRAVDDILLTIPANGQHTAQQITVAADKYTSTPVTAAQLQAALNTNTQIGATDGGVTVTLTPDNVFHVAFNNPAKAEPIQAAEVLPAFFTATPVGTTNGQASELQQGDGTSTPEVQEVKLSSTTDYFTLSLDGTHYTQPLASIATPQQVATALDANAVQSGLTTDPHYFEGGQNEGNVTGTPGDYTISFGDDNPQPLISVTQTTDQKDELIVQHVGSFHFGNAVNATELSSNATAAQVQAALMQADPSHQVQVTMPPNSHGVYFVKYLDGNTDTPPAVVDTLGIASTGPVGGTDTLTLARPAIFDETVYQNASIVGAIADLNHLGANQFAFLATAATGAPGEVFHLGDTAIDGLIAAKNLSQKTLNFTPQARLIINSDVNSSAAGRFLPVNPDPAHPTTPVFYDFLNDLA